MVSTLVSYGVPLALLAVAFRAVAALLVKAVLGFAILVVLAALVQGLQHTGPITTTSSQEAVATPSRSDAVPIPWAETAPTWRTVPRCPAAAAKAANLPDLQARVDQLHLLRDAYSRDYGTTAIVRAENQTGTCLDFVAVQTDRNVEPAVRDVLRPGEVPVWSETGLPPDWNVMHAEQKAIAAAYRQGYRPIALASSRPFCDDGRDAGRQSCDAWLTATLAIRVTDRTAWWLW